MRIEYGYMHNKFSSLSLKDSAWVSVASGSCRLRVTRLIWKSLHAALTTKSPLRGGHFCCIFLHFCNFYFCRLPTNIPLRGRHSHCKWQFFPRYCTDELLLGCSISTHMCVCCGKSIVVDVNDQE